MGRRKIEIRAIKDDRNRSVTFLKRKGGLFKKAHELSVLCSVDVAVIIFGHNKKLYEFSSGDINETLRRYQYYGQAHEHKGPADFKGKGGDDDEDDDEDDDIALGREDSMPPQHPQMMPPLLQHHDSYSHLRQQQPSASPPMQNGMFQPRHGTPQPQMGSRPNSRNTIRRTSSNLIPMQHPHATPPPPPQNGFAYMPNPPIYNPQAHPPPQPSPQPPFQQFPQHMPAQHQPPPPPPAPQPQVQTSHQAFLEEQRRHSQPQLIRHETLQPPQIPVSRASPQPEQQSLRPPDQLSPPQPKHLSSKSRSIFTPIDDGGSILAQHFMLGDSSRDKAKHESSSEIRPPPRSVTAPTKPRSTPQPPRPQVSEFPPPSRTNTSGSKSGASRPRLKVQIPSEASDAESGTGGSSPRQSGGATSANPTRNSMDSHHSGGILLPPPSPSASAVLSAGASGPPNPFARPAPPGSNPSNTNAYMESRNNVETPISALPSRFMNENLLPSPSSFYPEWGFGRTGPDSAYLPSPLPFPTPIQPTAPNSFARGENETSGEKRKSEEEKLGEAKKVKI